MLDLLLKKNIDPNILVAKYFYSVDKKVYIDVENAEHYITITDEAEPNKLNSKYGYVVFLLYSL